MDAIKSTYVDMVGKSAKAELDAARETLTLEQRKTKIREEAEAAKQGLIQMEVRHRKMSLEYEESLRKRKEAAGEDLTRINDLIAEKTKKIADQYARMAADVDADMKTAIDNLIEVDRLSGDTDQASAQDFEKQKQRINLLRDLNRINAEEQKGQLVDVIWAQIQYVKSLDQTIDTKIKLLKLAKEMESARADEEPDKAADDQPGGGDNQDLIDALNKVVKVVNTINELWDIGKDLIEASETGGWALAEAFGEAGQGVADMAGQLTGLPLGEVYGAVAGLVERVFDGVLKWRQQHDDIRRNLIWQTEQYKNQIDLVNDLLDVEQKRLKTQKLFNDILVGNLDTSEEAFNDLKDAAFNTYQIMIKSAKELGLTTVDLGLGFVSLSGSIQDAMMPADLDAARAGYMELVDRAEELRRSAEEDYAQAAKESYSEEFRDAATVRADAASMEADAIDQLVETYGDYLADLAKYAAMQRALITDEQATLKHRKAMGEFDDNEIEYLEKKKEHANELLILAQQQLDDGLITIDQFRDIQLAAKAANDEQAEFMTTQGAGPDFSARKRNLQLMLDLEKISQDEYRERMLTLLDEQLGYIDSIRDSYATQLDYANARMEIELEIAALMAGQNDMSDEAIAKLSELNRQRQAMILAGRTGAEVDPAAVAAIEDQIISTMTDAGASQEAIQAAIAGFSMASYDKGTPYVPEDMVARVHAGERILTSTENQDLISAVQGLASDRYLTDMVSLFRGQIESARSLGYSGEGGGDSVFAPTVIINGAESDDAANELIGALQDLHADWHDQDGTGNNREICYIIIRRRHGNYKSRVRYRDPVDGDPE